MTDAPQDIRDDLVRQRHALTEFGRLALHTDDLNEILQQACVMVSHGCGGVKAKLLEYMPGEDKLLVRAGVGWTPGFVGSARLDAGKGSAAGYALKTGEPVITHDVATETRFSVSAVLLNQGVASLINVLIDTPGGEPFGVLEVDSEEPREFDQNDVDFLRTYANLLGAAIDRHERTRELTEAVQQKDVLMRELQHRVKNDLQMVGSLISMEQRRSGPEFADKLSGLRDRIETIRQLNEKLYQGQRFDRLDLAAYLEDLARSLVQMDGSGEIRLDADLERVDVDTRIAGPLGLILNEFITNTVKHAFGGEAGTVSISLRPAEEGRWRLTLADSGPGLPQGAADTGTGLRLIALLAKQAGAGLDWGREPGAKLAIDFQPTKA